MNRACCIIQRVKVTPKDVEHAAVLARLGLTAEEKGRFTEQLSAILEYAQTINSLNTDNVQPTSHAIPMKNVFRADEMKPCENTDEIIANAPSSRDNMFSVPKIME
jgi:aspartyl-tRNA(Asn)/glutamyl-tRNA(Gln) amidotransferase subunit C